MERLWFLGRDKPDFEREQLLLLAFIRDALNDAREYKLQRLHECGRLAADADRFAAERTLDGLDPEQSDRMSRFNRLPDDDPQCAEVHCILEWARPELWRVHKELRMAWRLVETSFDIRYLTAQRIGNRCTLLIRYAGSHITEVYRCERIADEMTYCLLEYTDSTYDEIVEKYGSMCILAESSMAFDTERSTMPFLEHFMLSRVFSAPSLRAAG